jgi:phosphatidylglycerophosphate synthase
MPSIAELRAVGQPEWLHTGSGYEHWAGRLYMRRLSPHVTRLLVATPLSPNTITALLIPTGLLAALCLTLPGLAGAVGAVLLVQLWLLLDCCDGEVARWRRTFSPVGPYLDGLSHSLTQAALPAALGIRADGGWDSVGGWTALGLLAALLVLLVSLESHLVHSVRARRGKPPLDGSGEASTPRRPTVRTLRGAVRLVPFYRALNPVEASLLALAAAIVDTFGDDLGGTRVLVVGLFAAAAVTAAGHLLVILSSDRLE